MDSTRIFLFFFVLTLVGGSCLRQGVTGSFSGTTTPVRFSPNRTISSATGSSFSPVCDGLTLFTSPENPTLGSPGGFLESPLSGKNVCFEIDVLVTIKTRDCIVDSRIGLSRISYVNLLLARTNNSLQLPNPTTTMDRYLSPPDNILNSTSRTGISWIDYDQAVHFLLTRNSFIAKNSSSMASSKLPNTTIEFQWAIIIFVVGFIAGSVFHSICGFSAGFADMKELSYYFEKLWKVSASGPGNGLRSNPEVTCFPSAEESENGVDKSMKTKTVTRENDKAADVAARKRQRDDDERKQAAKRRRIADEIAGGVKKKVTSENVTQMENSDVIPSIVSEMETKQAGLILETAYAISPYQCCDDEYDLHIQDCMYDEADYSIHFSGTPYNWSYYSSPIGQLSASGSGSCELQLTFQEESENEIIKTEANEEKMNDENARKRQRDENQRKQAAKRRRIADKVKGEKEGGVGSKKKLNSENLRIMKKSDVILSVATEMMGRSCFYLMGPQLCSQMSSPIQFQQSNLDERHSVTPYDYMKPNIATSSQASLVPVNQSVSIQKVEENCVSKPSLGKASNARSTWPWDPQRNFQDQTNHNAFILFEASKDDLYLLSKTNDIQKAKGCDVTEADYTSNSVHFSGTPYKWSYYSSPFGQLSASSSGGCEPQLSIEEETESDDEIMNQNPIEMIDNFHTTVVTETEADDDDDVFEEDQDEEDDDLVGDDDDEIEVSARILELFGIHENSDSLSSRRIRRQWDKNTSQTASTCSPIEQEEVRIPSWVMKYGGFCGIDELLLAWRPQHDDMANANVNAKEGKKRIIQKVKALEAAKAAYFREKEKEEERKRKKDKFRVQIEKSKKDAARNAEIYNKMEMQKKKHEEVEKKQSEDDVAKSNKNNNKKKLWRY